MIITNLTEDFLNSFCKQQDRQLIELEQFARANHIPVMIDQTANFLATITRIIKPKTILEIGTAIGYSGTILLNNAPKGCKLTTFEKDSKSFEIANQTFKKFNKTDFVTAKLGDAKELIDNQTGTFDMIFLDGPKGQYIRYLDKLISLLNEGGVLVSDNVLFKGMITGECPTPRDHNTIKNNMTKFIQTVFENKNLQSSLLNIGDGILLSIKLGAK